MRTEIVADRVREVLSYDPETGEFHRKIRTAQRHQVGDRADFLIEKGEMAGYRRVAIDGKRYLAHRLAWLYMYGVWPQQQIDHKDTNRSNNAISNLRDVSDGTNKENMRSARKDNKASGFLGVIPHHKKWRARIQVNGKNHSLGLYGSPEEAHQAYVAAKRKLHQGCTI